MLLLIVTYMAEEGWGKKKLLESHCIVGDNRLTIGKSFCGRWMGVHRAGSNEGSPHLEKQLPAGGPLGC